MLVRLYKTFFPKEPCRTVDANIARLSCKALDAREQLLLTTKLLSDSLAGVVNGILMPSEIVRARETRFTPTFNFLLLQ